MNPSREIPNAALARGVFAYRVDVRPRALPMLSLGDGTGSGEWRDVLLTISHPDAYAGERDVAGMLIYGDVDPRFHPRIGATDVISATMDYAPQVPLILSAGSGTKTINVRLYFQSNRSVLATITYTLLDGEPHVSILRQPRREFISTSMPVEFAWSCSHATTAYAVCLAPSYNSPRSECAPIVTGTNVSGGVVAAGTSVTSVFSYANALLAVPDAAGADALAPLDATGFTFVKVFCTTAKGITS